MDFDRKLVTVQVKDGTEEQSLVAAIKNVGFGATLIEAVAPAVPENAQGRVHYSSRLFAERVSAHAVLDADKLRPGDRFRIAVSFEIKDGWHIYGNPVGPGVGKATSIEAVVPDGVRLEKPRYAPAEKAQQDFGEAGTSWVWQHTGRVTHYIAGTVQDGAKPGKSVWTIKAFAQACTETACNPGRISIPLDVVIAPRDAVQTKLNDDQFAGFDTAQVPDDA